MLGLVLRGTLPALWEGGDAFTRQKSDVTNRPLSTGDRLDQHCFKDTRGWYFDEARNRLESPVPPVGQWGLHSYRTIDDENSKALGIPLSEEP